MTTSSTATLLFFPLLALQGIVGLMVAIGLVRLGFWKTAVLEICKLAVALPQAFRFRRASLLPETVQGHSSLAPTAGVVLLTVSAFSDVILIYYDEQRGPL
jgi:hypothetical protein